MKAVTIVRPGGVEVLEVREVAAPQEVSADQVRVRVRAAALNRADLLQRAGRYPAPEGVPKDIPGLEFAGEIDQIGDAVRGWQPGQRVFGITGGGAQAEQVVVSENTLVEIPADLDWVEAAAVPEAFITAHDALFTQAHLQMGERLFIPAVGSGVGLAAAQLARAAGASVMGSSRTADKLERVRPYGLSAMLLVKDDPQLILDAVRQWTSGKGVDVILDLVGAAYFEAHLAALAYRGRMMMVGTTSGNKANLDFSIMMRRRLTVTGTVLRARSAEEKASATRLFGAQVTPLLASGAVRPVIDRTYKIEDVREAHARLESNSSFGKVVLTID